MTKNPILDELHKTRRRLLVESGGSLETLVRRLQDEERTSGREIAKSNRRRTIRSTEAAKSVAVTTEKNMAVPGDR